MNETMEAAVQQAVDALNQQYVTLRRFFDSTCQEKKDMIAPLTIQLSNIQQLREGIIAATHNSHVGAPQCCEALDSAIQKLSAAINRLEQI